MPPKANAAKKTATPIPKAGATSVVATASLKKTAIENKLAEAFASDATPDAVDSKMFNHSSYKVHTNNGQSFSAYLMCADLKNNNNKFYVCQVVQNNTNG